MGVEMKETLARGYAAAFARPSRFAQKVNHTLYHLALRGMGYNNGWQPNRSGEAWFIRNVLTQNGRTSIAFDIGANIGEYSTELMRAGVPQVYAFEPLPEAFARLEVLKRTYAVPGQFFCHQIALSNTNGIGNLHFGDPTTEHATLSDDAMRIDYVGAGNTKTVPVYVSTLDTFMQSSDAPLWIDFMKIDVEGFEYEVLEGATETLANYHPPFIQIEWNLHQLMRGHTLLHFIDLINTVSSKTYDVYQMLPRGLRKVDPKRPEANTFCYGNFVFALQGVL